MFANNDSAYDAALRLHDAGVAIAAIVDPRPQAALVGDHPQRARAAGIPILPGSAIVRAHGRLRVAGVDLASLGGGAAPRIDCDLVCVSGGWNPAVHLYSQARGKLRYDDALATFVPDAAPQAIVAAGAANGSSILALSCRWTCRRTRHRRALGLCGTARRSRRLQPPRVDRTLASRCGRCRRARGAKCFVDLQNDVTVADIALAAREGYRSVEHLKRYTTLGMGTDQGKTGNIVGLALLAAELGVTIPRVGTTTFRPPYTPVTLGALAGHERGAHVEPMRLSAMHDWHVEHGARMLNAGLWKRPHSYPRAGESEDDAANREAKNVRTQRRAGRRVDAGQDRAAGTRRRRIAQSRLYQPLGHARGRALPLRRHAARRRHGVRRRHDLAPGRDALRDDDDDRATRSTSCSISNTCCRSNGPSSRYSPPRSPSNGRRRRCRARCRARCSPSSSSIDVSNAAFPFLAVGECELSAGAARIPARLFRMSYSGELAYEIHVPVTHGRAMWEAVMAAGEPFGIMPYGTEAMSTLAHRKGTRRRRTRRPTAARPPTTWGWASSSARRNGASASRCSRGPR